jgi:hypothetical protein
LHYQLLIQRTAVDANADGLAVISSDVADGGKLFVAALACAYVSRINAIFVERYGAIRILCEQDVAVVVEVANDRYFAAGGEQAFLDLGDGGGGFEIVDGPANDFRAAFGELDRLLEGGFDVSGIGVGHRLHDDGSTATHADVADVHTVGFATRPAVGCGVKSRNLREHTHLFYQRAPTGVTAGAWRLPLQQRMGPGKLAVR